MFNRKNFGSTSNHLVVRNAETAIPHFVSAATSHSDIQRFSVAADYKNPVFFENKKLLTAFFQHPSKFMKTLESKFYHSGKGKSRKSYRVDETTLKHMQSILNGLKPLEPTISCKGEKSVSAVTTFYIYERSVRKLPDGRNHTNITEHYALNDYAKKVCEDPQCVCRNSPATYVTKSGLKQLGLKNIFLDKNSSALKLNEALTLVRYSFHDFYQYNKQAGMTFIEEQLKEFLSHMAQDFGFPKNLKDYKNYIIFQLEQKLNGKVTILPASKNHPQNYTAPVNQVAPVQGLLFE